MLMSLGGGTLGHFGVFIELETGAETQKKKQNQVKK